MKRLSSNLVALLGVWSVNGAFGQTAEPPAQRPETSIEYSTLDEAIAALRAKPGVTFRDQAGWRVAEDLDGLVVWLFTPPGHPAYPSMVKRTIVNRADGAHFETAVRCFASKGVCDKYFGGN
jgi:hypothetical protein